VRVLLDQLPTASAKYEQQISEMQTTISQNHDHIHQLSEMEAPLRERVNLLSRQASDLKKKNFESARTC
jgi:polyhydroxyalkanoate synthesis regulator phasin